MISESYISGAKARKARFTSLKGALLAATWLMVAPLAHAQSSSDSVQSTSADGFQINLQPNVEDYSGSLSEFVGLSDSLKGVIELPAESMGSRLFDLDVANIDCFTAEASCLTRSEIIDMEYSNSITASLDAGLDIELLPRASVRFDDDSSSALVGALVRIGDDLKDTSDFKNNTWYMFAGADAEAVTYSPNSVKSLTRGQVHYQDKVIVGDAQAGVGYRMGDADVSVGYFRREVSSFGRELDTNGVSYTEDAAALSFTWRR